MLNTFKVKIPRGIHRKMDIYLFILLSMGMILGASVGFRAVSAKIRPKPKDNAQKELNNVYEGTIKELKARVNSQRQRIYHMESGAGAAVAKMDNGEGVEVDAIRGIYDEYVPDAIKHLVPFEAAQEWVEKNPDKIKGMIEKVKGKFKKEGISPSEFEGAL